MLHTKSLKKELASSYVGKACHKKKSLDCKTKMEMEDGQLRISSNWEVRDEYGILNMEKRY